MECQRTIVAKGWMGHSKRKCGRLATKTMPDGLPVCERHFNRWKRKIEKRTKAKGGVA